MCFVKEGELSRKSLSSVPVCGSENFILRQNDFIYAYRRDGVWERGHHLWVSSFSLLLAELTLPLITSPRQDSSVSHRAPSSCRWVPTASLSPFPATETSQPSSVCKSRKKGVGFYSFHLSFLTIFHGNLMKDIVQKYSVHEQGSWGSCGMSLRNEA